jgi:adenine-specific DNA-methyltransferase
MKAKIRDGYVEFREDHTKTPFLKSYLYVEAGAHASEDDPEGEKLQVMGSVFYRHSQPANDVLKGLFGEKIFENPKDHGVIARLIRYCTDRQDTVLDFFAGSGTAAHSVLDLNRRDMGGLKLILVQLPERLDPSVKEHRAASDLCDQLGKPRTIAEVTKERVRRVIAKLDAEDAAKDPSLFEANAPKPDRGFRVFKLDESCFKPWEAGTSRDAGALADQLDLFVDHVREGRTEEDLLFEILLKSGFPLTTRVGRLDLAGKTVYSVQSGALLVCLERELTLDLVRAIADARPERVVCLDQGFAGNDQLKANAVQIFKAKGVTSFKTV